MTNPLIAKYEEIYGKKEEPKKKEPPEFWKESPFAYDPTTSVTPTTINPNSLIPITSTNHITFNPVISYEPTEDAFLDVASKVQKGDAKVVSMHMNMEHFRKSYTFEVQVYT